MTEQHAPAPEAPPKPTAQRITSRRIPPWRWAWMGFAVATLLWFGSGIYFQRLQQFDEIEYSTGGMEESEYEQVTTKRIQYAFGCKIAAGILCLASLTFLVSQTDIHRPRTDD